VGQLHPAIDFFPIEAPIAAYFESRYLALFEQAIDGSFMNSQKLRDFVYGHYAVANTFWLTTFQLAHFGTNKRHQIPPLMIYYALNLLERKRLGIRFVDRTGQPFVNHASTKPPITTDLEGWNTALSQ
jgi:hypothetical protein